MSLSSSTDLLKKAKEYASNVMELSLALTIFGILSVLLLHILSVTTSNKFITEENWLRMTELFYEGGLWRFAGLLVPGVVQVVISSLNKSGIKIE